MAARAPRSKKRSDASDGVDSRPEPEFFVDRSIGGKLVVRALREAGATAHAHDDLFEQNCNDEVWLQVVGNRNWIVMSKDDHIRTRYLERRHVVRLSIKMFVASPGLGSGPQMAAAFVEALPAMLRMIRHCEGPFIARVSKDGVPNRLSLGKEP